jgi:hypothetical protein
LPSRKPQKHPKQATDHAADRKAALAFEKEQQRRESERAKEEVARQKERERRQHAVDKAQRALDAARRKHEENAADMQAELKALPPVIPSSCCLMRSMPGAGSNRRPPTHPSKPM